MGKYCRNTTINSDLPLSICQVVLAALVSPHAKSRALPALQKAQAKTSVNRPWHSSLCVGTGRDMSRIQHVLAALRVGKASSAVRKQGTVLKHCRRGATEQALRWNEVDKNPSHLGRNRSRSEELVERRPKIFSWGDRTW